MVTGPLGGKIVKRIILAVAIFMVLCGISQATTLHNLTDKSATVAVGWYFPCDDGDNAATSTGKCTITSLINLWLAGFTMTGNLVLSSDANEGMSGGGLADCDNATTSKVLWDATTNKFSCGTDQNAGGTPGVITVANEAGDTTSFPTFVTAATGDLGPKTNANLKYNASTGLYESTGFNAGSLGYTVSKTSGAAGDMSVYEANSTDTHGAGFRGPDSITGDGAYRIKLPDARAAAAGSVLAVTNAGEAGSGTAASPYIQTGSWIVPLLKSQVFTQCFTKESPEATFDRNLWRTPVGITIVAAHCLATGGTSLTGGFQECDGNGANCAGIDGATTMTCTAGTTVDDDGNLSNPSIDAGDFINWTTASVSGTQTEVVVCFDFTMP